MDRDYKKPGPDNRGYYYYDVGGGNSYGAANEIGSQRSIQDYLLIVRERIWIIVGILLAVLVLTTLVTINQTELYTAYATVRILRQENTIVQYEDVVNTDLRTAEDFNTQVGIFETKTIVERVARRLKGDDLVRFREPYLDGKDPEEVEIGKILAENRKIIPKRLTWLVTVEYTHPDRELAAKVANLFAEEFILNNQIKNLDESMKAVEQLRKRAEAQRSKLEEIELQLQDYRELHNTVSFEDRSDIETEKLRSLNLTGADAKSALFDAESRWKLIQDYQEKGKAVEDLAFIAVSPLVQRLKAEISTIKVEIASTSQRYRDKHPTMIKLRTSLQEAEAELVNVVKAEVEKVYSEMLRTKQRYEEAENAVAEQQELIQKLNRLSVDYDTLTRAAEVERGIYQQLVARRGETNITSDLANANATIEDKAVPPLNPSWPNFFLFFGAGAFGGCALGVGFAFIVAFLDDRVKSSYDVETVVGSPLLGIISEVKNLLPIEKAKIVTSNMESQAAEGFRALHSSLKLNPESKEAQCILITSTAPGEGKSFVSSNLALTFASHGEKTLLIDCDLRLPNVAKSLGLKNELGVIDYCYEKASFDEVVVKDAVEGLDVIPTGGRANNPSQILSSGKFEEFLKEARTRYSRIIIDTPPVSAVSDSLLVLPLVDGVIYTIKFNAVKRKTVAINMRRLTDSNVPIFGAVLNNLKLSVSGYYYSSYHYHKYRDYHTGGGKQKKLEDTRNAG